MPRIAFLGLGRMGSRMAARLVAAGHDVTVWNRTAARTTPLTEAGARTADTPAKAVAGAELVISMLTDPDAVNEVFLRDGGAAAGLSGDALVVEMSTIGPAHRYPGRHRDVSASDVVRTKVAYLDAIRALGQAEGRHPGLLILDELRQQDIDPTHT